MGLLVTSESILDITHRKLLFFAENISRERNLTTLRCFTALSLFFSSMTDRRVYGSQWDIPSRALRYPAVSPETVHRQTPVRSPDVVSIPVHYIRSARTRESALMIQKVFRAFLVRKNMGRIAAIKREVDAVEWRISKEDIVDLFRRDTKERLKVNETLMSLLLRLDSVRGVNSGVRDCRKSVIRRAITLQETVDAIAALDHTVVSKTHLEIDDPSAKGIDGSRSERIQVSSVDYGNGSDNALEIKDSIRRYSGTGVSETAPDLLTVSDDCTENNVDGPLLPQNPVAPVIGSRDSEVLYESSIETVDQIKENMDVSEVRASSGINTNKEGSDHKEIVEDPNSTTPVSEGVGVEGKQEGKKDQRNGELMEKIMDQNDRLVDVVTKLFAKNEAQTRLLRSLSQRVEHLERAFTCDK